MRRPRPMLLLVAAIELAVVAPAETAICPVPSSSHPTVRSAVADAGCTEIQLADGVFLEEVTISRPLTLRGVSSSSSILEGRVEVDAGTVLLEGLRIGTHRVSATSRYSSALSVHGAAAVHGIDLLVWKAREPPLFEDGFESGGTSGWSSATP